MKDNYADAKGVKGFLLWDFFEDRHFFRIYDKDKKFKDYKIRTEEIKVEIISGGLEFNEEKKSLDWSRKVLGKCQEE